MSTIEATLILPCYNEAEHFERSVERIITVLKKTGKKWEILFIDDTSTDQTPILINNLLKKPSSIPLYAIYHKSNQGRGTTVAQGITKARADIVGYIDIDCEIDPKYIPAFVSQIEQGADVVSAWRSYPFNWFRLLRYVASKLYVVIERVFLGVNFPDTEAGYKFFRRKKILPVLPTIFANHWFWDTEIMVRAKRAGLTIEFVPAVFLRRSDKTSTVRLFPDTIAYINDLWRLRKELTNESN